jgi:hypothetical protein
LTIAEEKTKNAILRKIAVVVGSGLLPEIYLDMVYNFCVGVLWLKFTLVYGSAISVLKELFRIYPQQYLKRHLDLLE